MFRRSQSCLRLSVSALALCFAAAAHADPVDFNLPAQPLGQSLREAARAAGLTVAVDGTLVAGKASPALSGKYEPIVALRRLLAGSGLTVTIEGGNALITRDTGETVLSPVQVETSMEDRAITENTRSYTSEAATTVTKTATPIKEIPNSISVITQQEMQDRAMTSVADALAQAPGVVAAPRGGMGSAFSSRTFNMNLMNDGVPADNGTMGGQGQFFDLAMYERIEVLRGPDGLESGTGMMGGAYNLVSKKASATPSSEASVSYGSWNNKRAFGDVTGPLNDDGSLRARLVVAGQERNFYYDNSRQILKMGYGEVEYDITPNTKAAVSVALQENRQGQYYGTPLTTDWRQVLPRSFNDMTKWSTDTRRSNLETISLEHHFADGWVANFKANWQQDDDYGLDSEAASGIIPGTSTVGSYYAPESEQYYYYHQATDTYVSGPFDLFGKTHKITVGFNTNRYDYNETEYVNDSVSNVDIYNLPSSLTTNPTGSWQYSSTFSSVRAFQYGPYGQVRFKVLDDLTLVGGARSTWYETTSSGSANWNPTKASGEVTPYGGIIYDLTKQISLYSSYSGIFIPNYYYDYSGKMLPPKEGNQIEVGTKGSFFDKKFNSSLAGFFIDQTNMPYLDTAHSVTTGMRRNWKSYYLAGQETNTYGIDAEVSGRPAPGVDLKASYDWTISKYVKNGGTSQGASVSTTLPRNQIKTWAKYSFEDGYLNGLSMGLGANALSRTWSSSYNIAQSAYVVVNGMVAYKLTDNVDATFNANNITDTKYWVSYGRTNPAVYNIYGDPANYLFTLHFKM